MNRHRQYFNKLSCTLALSGALIMSCWSPAFAESKSGVDPQVISLPKGPGSIEGLGESFEPQLNTGTATYRVKIAVSPGVNKHQPEIALEYNSGYGNSPLGIGWALNTEYIQRQTDKGLPGYADNDTFIYSKSGELVPTGSGVYRLKIEGLFMRFTKNGDAWEASEKDGTKLYFGTAASGKQVNILGTFQWVLEKSVDTNGNEIRYLYQTDGGQIYPSEIRYSIMSDSVYKSVHFIYELRPDAFTDYHSRSKILTAKRLAAIEVKSQGALVRRYQLTYKAGINFSQLVQVMQYGSDGTSSLPPLTFDYTTYNPESIKTVSMTTPPPTNITPANSNVDLIDIDGDALPDIICTGGTDNTTHKFYLNKGKGAWESTPVLPVASPQHLLATNGVMMSDMDGDGLADLFVKNSFEFGYFKNKGNLAWEEADWVPCSPNPDFSFESDKIKLVDVNNDKLIDVIRDVGGFYYVWLNHKDNAWNTEYDYITELPGGSHLSFDDPNVKLADMNGDRMEDLVYVIDDNVTYFPSMGQGAFDDAVSMANPPLGLGSYASKIVMSDINNDGLSDAVLIGNETITVWFNDGNNAFKDPVVFENTPAFIGGTSAFRFADMNADGFRDLLITNDASSDSYQYVNFNNCVHPNLLTKIRNGLGMETTISYASSTDYYLADRDSGNPWTTKLPFPVEVVSKTSVKDLNSGQEYVADYIYRNGYYDGAEKEFRGFSDVKKVEHGDTTAPTLVTQYSFDVGKDDESRKGMVKSVAALTAEGTIAPPSGLFDREENTITTRTLFTGINSETVRYSFITAKNTYLFEKTTGYKLLSGDFDQDQYGNTIKEFNYGLVEGADKSAGNDEVLTKTEYQTDEAKWMVNRPTQISKTTLAGGFISLQKNSYDNITGNLTKQEGATDGANLITLLTNAYDSYGNIITITDANSHSRTIGYDATFNTFPVSETIGGLGLSMNAGYDVGLGVITSFTDFNGNATGFGYDPLGRLTSIVKPGDSAELPTQVFAYNLSNPVSSVATQSREVSGTGDTYDAVSYYDGLGRKLQTKSEGPSSNWVVTDAATFNQRKGVLRKWLPYFSASKAYEVPDPAKTFTTFVYDEKGRSVKEINPGDGTFRTTVYQPLANSAYDEENKYRTFTNDGLGRLIQVAEHNAADTYTTLYEYDGQNNLTKVIDAAGNIKTMTFDGLARKTAMNDPDKHAMSYAYDPAGNLTGTTDAKGQAVSYTYDDANRILTENFNGVKAAYHYDLDLPAAYTLENTKGKLTYVEDEAGKEYYSYTERGNTAVKIREAGGYTFINRMAYDAMDRLTAFTYPDRFSINYVYNNMNQLEEIPGFVSGIAYTATGQKSLFIYANGIQSAYSYDIRQRMTNLSSNGVTGRLQDLTYAYDGVSNIKTIADNRPVKTTEDLSRTFQYDDLYRLTQAQAAAWTETYQYNSIGNMTFKSDIGAMTYGAGGAGPHALTRAATANINYTYDANGNISSKQPGFTYQFDHKDRLTQADRQSDGAEISYAYDYKGNRVIKSVTSGAATDTTVYADKFTELRGSKLIKQIFAGDRLVARLESTFDIAALTNRTTPLTADDFDCCPKDGVITLDEIRKQGADTNIVEASDAADALNIYYEHMGDNSTLLPFSTVAAAIHAIGTNTPPAGTATYFYVPDHLGSASIVTSDNGAIVEESVYYPYGKDRARSGAYKSEYRFTGKELDDETGLHYFGARFYDSLTGRFVSVDPLFVDKTSDVIKSPQGFNIYAYTANPVRFIDPNGLSLKDGIDYEKGAIKFIEAPNWSLIHVKGSGGGNFRKVPGAGKMGLLFKGASQIAGIGLDIKRGDKAGAIAGMLDLGETALESMGENSAKYFGQASSLLSVVKGGYDEMVDRGYTVGNVVDAWKNAGENIKFGVANPDAFINAGVEGFTSMTAVTVNALAGTLTGGAVSMSGKEIQTGIENSVNKVFGFFGL